MRILAPWRRANAHPTTLSPLQYQATGVGTLTLSFEAFGNLLRQPARTLLCALGTVVAVGALVTLEGLGATTNGAVTASFNELRATTVEFQGGISNDLLINAQGVSRLQGLRGVTSAGLLWDIDQQAPIPVSRTPPAGSDVQSGTDLSFTAVSPSALTAIGAKVTSGRLYDYGADQHHQMVALLGTAAAQQLGINSTFGAPAIFVGHSALTVVGIIGSTQQEGQLLLGVVVPPYVAGVIGGASNIREVIARTRPGAAQMIGREGPYALSPYSPSLISAEVPPDPSTLRAQVASSLSTLLAALGIAGLAIGLASIITITTLSVTQRRSEIGLRRSVGYQRRDIAKLIVIEATGVGALGGITGACAGVLTVSLVATTRSWIPIVTPQSIVVALLAGVAMGMVAGCYPAMRAMRVTPMAALRS